MDNPIYPIKYDAPDGHMLRKAHVSPAESVLAPEGVGTQKPSEPYPLQSATQTYPLGK